MVNSDIKARCIKTDIGDDIHTVDLERIKKRCSAYDAIVRKYIGQDIFLDHEIKFFILSSGREFVVIENAIGTSLLSKILAGLVDVLNAIDSAEQKEELALCLQEIGYPELLKKSYDTEYQNFPVLAAVLLKQAALFVPEIRDLIKNGKDIKIIGNKHIEKSYALANVCDSVARCSAYDAIVEVCVSESIVFPDDKIKTFTLSSENGFIEIESVAETAILSQILTKLANILNDIDGTEQSAKQRKDFAYLQAFSCSELLAKSYDARHRNFPVLAAVLLKQAALFVPEIREFIGGENIKIEINY